MESRDRQREGEAIALSGFVAMSLLAGGNGVAIRFSNRELDPLWGAALRFALATTVLLALMAALRLAPPRGRALAGALLYGALTFGAGFGLGYYALVEMHAGLGQTLLALVPLATVLLGATHGEERLRPRAIGGALVALAGIVVISGPSAGDAPPLSVLAAIGSALCFAEAAVLVRRFPAVHPVTMNAIGMAAGTALLTIASVVAGQAIALPAQSQTWLALGYLVAVGSVVVFVLYLIVLRYWTASRASYEFVLVPFVTVALSAWLDDEPVGAGVALGGLLVLAGVYLGALRPDRANAIRARRALALSGVAAVVALTCGALAQEAYAHAGGQGSFSCRASALRTPGAGPAVEPVVANAAGSPCADEARSGQSVVVPGLLSATPLVAHTDADPADAAGGQAEASVARAVVTLAGHRIETGLLRSRVNSFCSTETSEPGVTGSSSVAWVRIDGGLRLPIGAAPISIPLGPVALYLNRKIVSAGKVTQRAIELSVPGKTVVLAEAVAGVERCDQPTQPPTAVLEIETPPIDAGSFPESCSSTERPPDLFCEYEAARSVWTPWEPGEVFWGFCGAAHETVCNSYPPGEFPFTFSFRAISSTDPDDDLETWSIDFGDGTTASGDWTASPPTELTQTYLARDVPDGVTLTLTVTDSGGRSDTDTLTLRFISLNPI